MKRFLKILVLIAVIASYYLIYLGSVALIHHHYFLSGMIIITISSGLTILAIAFCLIRIAVAFISGEIKVKLPISITVDGDLDPNVTSGLYLTEEESGHRKMGKITFEKNADGKLYLNGIEVIRYYSPGQRGGKFIKGYDLRNELKGKRVLNAHIMDVLMENPQIIPDEWKTGSTYFWGTIFRNASGRLYVEFLYWSSDKWHWSCDSLDHYLDGSEPAAVLVT